MDDRRRIADIVRNHLARERISRDEFAHRSRLGRSTVDKLLVGLFSERTLAVVEATTGLALHGQVAGPALPDAAPGAIATATAEDAAPSIAVLPFTFMGESAPAQDWLADGITEDIITDLARLRWLFVIARNSTFTYKGRAVDVRDVARDLGVRYVLEGSVRVAGGRIRVTGQLIDAATGRHIWAERYDREMADIFAVQDEITRNVVAAIEPHLYAEEGFRAAARPTANLSAWGLAVRAMGLINKVGRAQNEEARRLLEAALALEPGYARAQALLAWAGWWGALCYWWPDNAEGYRQAARHAAAAVAQDPSEPWARMTHGMCLSSARQHEAGLVELRAALDLNPCFALGRTLLGWGLLRAGRMEEAIAQTGLALRMSPMDSFAGIYTAIHGLALLGDRRFDEALPHLRASVAAFAEYLGHYNTLISCCGHLGRFEEAQGYIAARNRMGPPIRVALLRRNLAGFAHADVFVEGLVKAGVPE
jgi:TolB-like protein